MRGPPRPAPPPSFSRTVVVGVLLWLVLVWWIVARLARGLLMSAPG